MDLEFKHQSFNGATCSTWHLLSHLPCHCKFLSNNNKFTKMYKDRREQTLLKFVKGYYHKIENLIQRQTNDNFNQEIFKAIAKIRNKHKQQINVESIFEQIIKTTGNETISKAFLEDRIETLVTDDMLNKLWLERNSCYLT